MLNTVPFMEQAGNAWVLLSNPSSEGAGSFRKLRAILNPPAGSRAACTVLFAGASRGEGKSFCALNHAISLALQGHRTLLLDADLRSPGLGRECPDRSGGSPGLGGYLDGSIEAAAACFATSLPNLHLFVAGPARGDAAELLAGTRFATLLEEALRFFDRVVIDSPPVLAVSDALEMARHVDRICMVVRENACDHRELKTAAERLRDAGGNVVGFVWNRACRPARSFTDPLECREEFVG